jgi:hypothetical protein
VATILSGRGPIIIKGVHNVTLERPKVLSRRGAQIGLHAHTGWAELVAFPYYL